MRNRVLRVEGRDLFAVLRLALEQVRQLQRQGAEQTPRVTVLGLTGTRIASQAVVRVIMQEEDR